MHTQIATIPKLFNIFQFCKKFLVAERIFYLTAQRFYNFKRFDFLANVHMVTHCAAITEM